MHLQDYLFHRTLQLQYKADSLEWFKTVDARIDFKSEIHKIKDTHHYRFNSHRSYKGMNDVITPLIGIRRNLAPILHLSQNKNFKLSFFLCEVLSKMDLRCDLFKGGSYRQLHTTVKLSAYVYTYFSTGNELSMFMTIKLKISCISGKVYSSSVCWQNEVL